MSADRIRRFFLVGAVLALMVVLFPQRVSVQSQPPVPVSATSRDWSQEVPAHFARVDGEVTLVRDGRLEPAEANQILLTGDRLRTQGGRAQILFIDGSTLALDEDTTMDLLSDSLVRLIGGRLYLTIPRTTQDLDYRVDASAGFAEIQSAGEYRVQTGTDRRGKLEMDLIVIRGSATLGNDFGRTAVRAGYHAVTSADTEPSLPYAVNSAAWDDFDQWVDGLREAHIAPVQSASAEYLPQEEQYYATTLDTYGTWDYIAPYGAVWYPRVAVGWRPYWQGRWGYTGHYGWGWVGVEHWAWPTYHYGRWGISSVGWYWIPDHHWGPAWVAWGGAPGYVGWCPLGYDGFPVVGFGVVTPYYMDPWSAWTVMPAHAWTHNVWVTDYRLQRDAIPAGVRSGFAQRRGGPAPIGDAPRRDIGPIGAPTMPRDVAVTRRPAPTTSGLATGGRRADVSLDGFPVPVLRGTDSTRAVPRDVDPRNPSTGRTQSSDGFPASRAFPQTSPGMPSAYGNQNEASRAMPRGDTVQSAPTRAVPRGTESRPASPVMGADTTQDVRRAPGPSRAMPQSMPDPPSDRGRAVERTAPPVYSAPPPSRRAPEPPASAAPPPPSRGRSVAPPAQSAPPPATSQGRGGGSSGGQASGSGTAVPRRGGGGG
jgi:hypothetical protein